MYLTPIYSSFSICIIDIHIPCTYICMSIFLCGPLQSYTKRLLRGSHPAAVEEGLRLAQKYEEWLAGNDKDIPHLNLEDSWMEIRTLCQDENMMYIIYKYMTADIWQDRICAWTLRDLTYLIHLWVISPVTEFWILKKALGSLDIVPTPIVATMMQQSFIGPSCKNPGHQHQPYCIHKIRSGIGSFGFAGTNQWLVPSWKWERCPHGRFDLFKSSMLHVHLLHFHQSVKF